MIHQTLKDLLKALKGLVVMSQSLETMANSIFNNMVPELWASKVGNVLLYNMNLWLFSRFTRKTLFCCFCCHVTGLPITEATGSLGY